MFGAVTNVLLFVVMVALGVLAFQAGTEERIMYRISDRELNEYYAKDYYGPGTNYFDPPHEDEFTEDDIDEILRDVWEDEYV